MSRLTGGSWRDQFELDVAVGRLSELAVAKTLGRDTAFEKTLGPDTEDTEIYNCSVMGVLRAMKKR